MVDIIKQFKVISYFLWLLYIIKMVSSQTCPNGNINTTESKLRRCLLQNIDTSELPNQISDEMVILNFAIHDLIFDGYDKIFLYGWLQLLWSDEKLVWDTDAYDGIDYLAIPGYKIWVPSLFTKDGGILQSGYKKLTRSNTVMINPAGQLSMAEMVVVSGKCDSTDFSNYPFNIHRCKASIYNFDSNVQYSVSLPEMDLTMLPERHHRYYNVLENLSFLEHYKIEDDVEQPTLEFQIVFTRYSNMTIILLHVPVLAFLFFNFISLWITTQSIMIFCLPTISFLGSLYQMYAILDSFTTDLLDASPFEIGEEPLHIVHIYKHVLIISLMVLLYNFMKTLFRLNRKMLLKIIMSYLNKNSSTKTNVYNISTSSNMESSTTADITTIETSSLILYEPMKEDYALLICDVIILMYMAYTFIYFMIHISYSQ